MKRLVVIVLSVCISFSFTACNGKSDSGNDTTSVAESRKESVEDVVADDEESAADDEKLQTDGSNESTDAENEDSGEANDQSSDSKLELSTEKEDKSIFVTEPVGFDKSEGMSHYSFAFTKVGENANDIIAISMVLKEEMTENLKDSLIEEVKYTASANAEQEADISDISTDEVDGRAVEYFTYSYSSGNYITEGGRFWTVMSNGSVFCCTVEQVDEKADTLDITEYIHKITKGISE